MFMASPISSDTRTASSKDASLLARKNYLAKHTSHTRMMGVCVLLAAALTLGCSALTFWPAGAHRGGRGGEVERVGGGGGGGDGRGAHLRARHPVVREVDRVEHEGRELQCERRVVVVAHLVRACMGV